MFSSQIVWTKEYRLNPPKENVEIKVHRFTGGYYEGVIVYSSRDNTVDQSNTLINDKHFDAETEVMVLEKMKKWISEEFGKGYTLSEIQI